MNMKLKSTGLMLLVSLASSISIFSEVKETPKTQSPTKSGEGILRTVGNSPDRKRSPSHNILELYYENGVLTLTSQTQELVLSMQLINSGTTDVQYISEIAIGESIPVNLDYGIYSVSANSSLGAEFSGEIWIQ